jgi:hypothetical protein
LAATSKSLTAAESLYRDANTLAYADNKPSEEAIDRVVGKMNAEWVHVALPSPRLVPLIGFRFPPRSQLGHLSEKQEEQGR